MKFYMPIAKVDELSDGTLMLSGIASTEAVDSDGEIITAAAMKAALPDYFKHGTGALREMHQPSAAGTVGKAEIIDGQTHIEAHVVDPIAVLKVKSGVYKGLSIGGRVTERDAANKSTITGLKLVEVSLVDRPANPDAVFTMFKAESELSAIDEMAKMVNDGTITPERLLELAKADLTPDQVAVIDQNSDAAAVVKAQEIAAVAAAEAAAAAAVHKGMGHVADLASLLKAVSWLCMDQCNEAEREGDGSTVPASLKAWLDTGLGILNAMTAEETAELLACVPDNGAGDSATMIEMADAAIDLEKAGARNSKTDLHTVQSMHDGAVALGASCGADKADAAGDLAKADTLAKAETDRDEAIAKAATLEARITVLLAAPVDGKAVLTTIAKSGDTITPVTTAEPIKVIGYDGKSDDIATMIKSIHATPIGRAL